MAHENSLMFEIACLYYENNLTQESIARRLKISKYKVNRVLKKAQTEGVVQIKVIRSAYENIKKV
jgi:deoxyribonucleoside regulator